MGNQGSSNSTETMAMYAEYSLMKTNEMDSLYKQILFEYPFLVDVFESMIVTDNRKGNIIIYVNDTFEKLTGYKREEILGVNCRFLQGKYTDQKTVDKIRKALANGSAIDVELLNYTKDGTAFWNNLMMLPLHEEGKKSGEVQYFIGVQKDITSLKYGSDPKCWSPPEVAEWVEKIGLGEYGKAFVLHDISGRELYTAHEFPFIHPRDKSKFNSERSKLKENFLEYFDQDKQKLALCDIQFRQSGDYPTVEQIVAKQILRKKHIKVPVKSGNKSFFSSTEVYSISSLIPRLGDIDRIFIHKGNNVMVTFKTPRVMGIFQYSNRIRRTIPTQICAGNYPYFAGLRSAKEDEDAELVVFNASSLVYHNIKIWESLDKKDISPIKTLFVGKKSVVVVTTKSIIQIKLSDLKPKILELDGAERVIESKQNLSKLTSKKLLLGSKTEFQLFEIGSGRAKLLVEDEVSGGDRICLLDSQDKTVAATTKNELYFWPYGKEVKKFAHKFVTSIKVYKKTVVVGDVNGQICQYRNDDNEPRNINRVNDESESDLKMKRGIFSLWVAPNGWVFAGTQTGIKIWSLDVAAPAKKPLSNLKTQGAVVQLQAEKSQLGCLLCM
eukprot:TRINITY_DN6781_c0_g1_i2.p1 TRINITY_DN6781_c0_g1~~TRINITY_DN6781_c0_g1_i2.p1  ORF type:complete len:610 (+),score=126.75 TRINITY_DN6781_c0_g1_i2:121-1950(+)